jgi:CMP-N-acetylneuraminic acid synthetase
MLPVMKDAVNYFEKKTDLNFRVKSLIIVDPTSPLRTSNDINKAIKLFEKKKPDLLVSVHKAQHNPYFSVVEKKGKFYSLSKSPNSNPGSRQEVKEVFEINTIVWIYSRKAIFKIKKRIPKKTIIFITPIERSIDIDSYNDIKLIKYYLQNNKK